MKTENKNANQIHPNLSPRFHNLVQINFILA